MASAPSVPRPSSHPVCARHVYSATCTWSRRPYIIAETEMAAGKPMRESTGAGFRQVATPTPTPTPTPTLTPNPNPNPTPTPNPNPNPSPNQVASYLFGQNRPQQALPSGGGEKMSMTAPVRSPPCRDILSHIPYPKGRALRAAGDARDSPWNHGPFVSP